MKAGTRGECRREQILTVSEEFFAERGFDDTNLDLVAARLGLTRQAIYYYFKSKDDILVELVERGGSALIDALVPTVASDLEPREKLARVLANHVEHVLGNPVTFRVQFSEVRRMAPESITKVRQAQQSYVRQVASVIESGQEAGHFVAGPAIPMALLLVGMCNATLEWYQPGRHMAIPDIAAMAVATVMNGVLTPSPRAVETGSKAAGGGS
jgi:AcrR family transcriptional regulator